MWDLKPDAPSGVRSEFKPIDTKCPGHPCLRASAEDGQVDAQVGHRPLAQPQGGLPQLLAQLHRLRGPAARPAPARQRSAEHGFGVRIPRSAATATFPTTSTCRAGWAGARRFAGPVPMAASWASAMIRCSRNASPTTTRTPSRRRVRPAVVRGEPFLTEQQPRRRPDARSAQHAPRPAAADSTTRSAKPRASRLWIASTGRSSRAFSLLTSSRLKAAFDLEQGRSQAARPLWPDAVRAQHPDRAAAGRGGRPFRQRDLGPVLGSHPGGLRRLGHAHEQLRHPARQQAAVSRSHVSRR